jgi:hypothetical protein
MTRIRTNHVVSLVRVSIDILSTYLNMNVQHDHSNIQWSTLRYLIGESKSYRYTSRVHARSITHLTFQLCMEVALLTRTIDVSFERI